MPLPHLFFGGGADYPVWRRQPGGSVLATTIDKYCGLTFWPVGCTLSRELAKPTPAPQKGVLREGCGLRAKMADPTQRPLRPR